MMTPFLQVAIGGAAGSVLRYAAARYLPWHGPGFPVATFAVNAIGCLLIGLFAAAMAHRFGDHASPLLITGFLGGFTTFSAFSLDALTLWERGQTGGAILYIALTVAITLVAVIAGVALGRTLFAEAL